jgi:RNA polymerase sigma factor (sigma-70 family)
MSKEREGETGTRSDFFERVLEGHGDALWRLAGAYTDEPRDREDLYQEILVAVWQGLPRFRGDSSTRTYVFRIARNRAITFQRRFRRHPPAETLEPVADAAPSPAENAIARDEQARLRRAVRALPPPGREVVSLALEGLSNKEIAVVLGLSSNHVAVRLHRARASLREALECVETLDD